MEKNDDVVVLGLVFVSIIFGAIIHALWINRRRWRKGIALLATVPILVGFIPLIYAITVFGSRIFSWLQYGVWPEHPLYESLFDNGFGLPQT